MATAVPSDAEAPRPPQPERRVLARAVGVWWVRRLLEVARRGRTAGLASDEDELHEPAPVGR